MCVFQEVTDTLICVSYYRIWIELQLSILNFTICFSTLLTKKNSRNNCEFDRGKSMKVVGFRFYFQSKQQDLKDLGVEITTKPSINNKRRGAFTNSLNCLI